MLERSLIIGTIAFTALLPAWGRPPAVTYRNTVVPVALPHADVDYLPVEDADLSDQTREAMRRLRAALAEYPAFADLPPARRREIHDAVYMPLGLPNEDVADVEERFFDGPGGYRIRIRIYSPSGRQADPLPVVLYYHGGGMMVGSLEQYEPIVERLCQQSGLLVVSVDYRMSPEYKYPAAIDDSYAALLWTHENAAALGGDPAHLAVAGDSAGGLLAAAMTQLARDRGGPALTFQVLIYPAVGTRGHSRTMDRFAHGYVFGRKELEWAYGSWITDPDQMTLATVAPILANDFSGLPPAYVVSAEYEIMRDDIEEYARLLTEAGVSTRLQRFEGTVHPFMSMAGVIDAGKTVIDEAASRLRGAFGRSEGR
jgi:acetyl esterase